MNTKIYGIPNCDSCKKALKWLTEHNIDHQFINFKQAPPSEAQVAQWLEDCGVEKLLNKRSTTWKQLSDDEKSSADQSPVALIAAHSNLIKRPVLVFNNTVHLGFKAADYAAIFSIEDSQ